MFQNFGVVPQLAVAGRRYGLLRLDAGCEHSVHTCLRVCLPATTTPLPPSMSRRDYPVADRYYDDSRDRDSDIYRRPRRDRNAEDIDIDIDINQGRERYPESRVSRAPRGETAVKERETVVGDRRTERGPRLPDFLREDYGKSQAGPLVVRDERREDDVYSRAPTRRRSVETTRSRVPAEEDKLVIRERDRGPPYPRSERDEEVVYRERAKSRSRAPPPSERNRREDIDIDINIDRGESDARSRPPPRSEAPSRSDVRERDVDEIRFRRGGGDRQAPARTEIDREEIRFTERHSPPPRTERTKGRDRQDIDIDIDIHNHERSRPPPPRQRSMSRGALVAKEREEWIVRRKRESPPPPPRDYEKEEIIIRRRERSPTPEPPREPTPEPPPLPAPPPPEPIIRPPIIQEVITHHRHFDHGIERVRSPTPPPPAPPSPPPPPAREDDLEVAIHRQGIRNGRPFDENIDIDIDIGRERDRTGNRELVRRPRSRSKSTRRRSPSAGPPVRARRYDDDVAAEVDYYNRKIRERAYPGEAWDGATRDWGLVDVPPGTERVRMDGKGGGRQDIYWERYNGERKGKFYAGDRVYKSEFGPGLPAPAPPPAPLPPPARERGGEDIDIDINISREEGRRPAPREKTREEIRITERRVQEETQRGKTKDKMWTEITKDLVIKEAIDEMGYEYEETDDFFYVIEYLKYVSLSTCIQDLFIRLA